MGPSFSLIKVAIAAFVALASAGCALPAAPPAAAISVERIPMPIQARRVMAVAGAETPWNLDQIKRNHFQLQSQLDHPTVVAILDTGVDPHQPDLAGRLYPTIDVVGGDHYTSNGHNVDFTGLDGNGHGTHVAGIVAQVAAGSNTRILPIKVIPNSGVGDDHMLADGIERAIAWRDPADATTHVRVLNLSVSSPRVSERLRTAIRHATDAGLLVIGAAGNESTAVEFPASMPEVLSVGATAVTDQVADYSCYGDGLSMTAPGGSDETPVYSSWPTYLTSSDLDDGVSTAHGIAGLVGTSMAAPHVTGAAGVIWALHPRMSARQVRATILGTADDLGPAGPDAYYGFGRLNFQRAFDGDPHAAQ